MFLILTFFYLNNAIKCFNKGYFGPVLKNPHLSRFVCAFIASLFKTNVTKRFAHLAMLEGVSYPEVRFNTLLRLFIRLSLLWLLVTSSVTNADIVSSLYEARVPVDSQSTRSQEQAIQNAFQEVLVKVSGSRELLDDPNVKTRVRSARQFLQQYQFENEQQQLFFVANFDSAKVDGLLLDAGFPIWGSYRPSTILWLAEENESLERQLYSEYTENQLKQQLLHGVRRRGLSLIFPVVDLTDLSSAGIYDVWGRFTDNIINASQRYGTEVVMSARIYPQQELATEFEQPQPFLDDTDPFLQEGITEASEPTAEIATETLEEKPQGWQSDWFIFMDGGFEVGTLTNEDKNRLADELMDLLADKLAAKYAVRATVGQSGAGSQAAITVVNLGSLDAYVSAKRYFESLQAVTSIQLKSLQEQRAVFHVSLVGRVEDLLNTLQLDDRVQRVTDAFGRPIGDLEFTWNP